METKEALIAKIKKQQEKIKKDKSTGKKSFNLAKEKLDESREQTKKIQNMELDGVLDGMEGELPDELRKLMIEAKQLENECIELEHSANRNTENGTIIAQNQKDFKGQLVQILGVQSNDKIINEISRLGEYPEIVNQLKTELLDAKENLANQQNSQKDENEEKSPIQESIEEMMDRLDPLIEEAKLKNKDIYRIASTIHNTLHRLVDDPENEFFAAHARSCVIQARGYGLSDPEFTRSTTNNENTVDPRDFD